MLPYFKCLQELEPFQPKAEENSMRFLRLSQQVLAFKMSLRKKIETGKQALGDKFEKIDKEIEKLELKLKKSVAPLSVLCADADREIDICVGFLTSSVFS
jgi:hypothetical protein